MGNVAERDVGDGIERGAQAVEMFAVQLRTRAFAAPAMS